MEEELKYSLTEEVTEEPEDAAPAPELEDTAEEPVEVSEEPEDADLDIDEEPKDAEPAPELEDGPEEAMEIDEEPAETESVPATGEPPKKKKSKVGLILGIVFGAIFLFFAAAIGLGIYASQTLSLSVEPNMIELAEGETALVTAERYTRMNKLADKLAAADPDGGASALTVPEAPAFLPLIWTSSDPSVATVDENGTVSAVAPGICTVTVSTNSGVTASLPVTVREPLSEEETFVIGDWYSIGVQSMSTGEIAEVNIYALSVDETSLVFSESDTGSALDLTWAFDSFIEESGVYAYCCYLNGQQATYMF